MPSSAPLTHRFVSKCSTLLRIRRSSHERFDGTGYPDALCGDAIPLGASIIAVCDAFDAMVSERPYRSAMPVRGALEELRRYAGKQFAPQVVEAFSALVAEREFAPVPA